jgi:1-acyl-sn-glycerol-3-phosphate acyltransferase
VRRVRAVFQDLVLAPLVRTWCSPFSVSSSQVPQSPVVFVANHASHLDAPAILAALPRSVRSRVAIAAAEDYFYTRPLVGRLASLGFGAFPFPRQGTLGVQRAEALVADGWSVLLFPEGTRSADGSQHPFRHGVGHLLLNTGVPAVPVAIVGSHGLWPRGRHLPRRGPLAVHVGAPWTPESHLSAGAIADELAGRVARCCAQARAAST